MSIAGCRLEFELSETPKGEWIPWRFLINASGTRCANGEYTLLESNISWSVESFTDTVHDAEEPLFYKIEVQLNPSGF